MTNNRVVIVCLLSWLVFIPGVTWVPLLYFLDFANAFGFTFGLTCLCRYLPGAVWAIVRVLRGKQIGRGSMLVLGIVKTWLAILIRTGSIWHWRWLSEPYGGLDTMWMAAAAWLTISGGSCHVAASAMADDHVELPSLSNNLVTGATLAGLALGSGIAYWRWTIAA